MKVEKKEQTISKTVGKRQQDDKLKPNHISNYIKYKWTKCSK